MFKKVKTLLSERTRWCKGTLARNKYRHAVKVESDSACKFCLVGAINRIYGDDYYKNQPIKKKLASSINKLFPQFASGYSDENTIIRFNDSSTVTYDDVKKVISHANV